MDTDYPQFIPRKVQELALEKKLGIFLLRNSSQFQWWCKEYLFEEGVIQVRSILGFLSIQALFYWREVSIFRTLGKSSREHEVSQGSVISQYTRHLKMEFSHGSIWKINLYGDQVRTWDQDFFRYGIRDHQPSTALLVSIQIGEKIAAAQVEQIRGEVEAGSSVNFGRISATVEGISWDEQSFPWEEVAEIGGQLLRGRDNMVYIGVCEASPTIDGKRERGVAYSNIPAEEVYNLPTLQLLRDVMNSDTPIMRKGVRDQQLDHVELARIQTGEKGATQVEQLRKTLQAGGTVEFGRVSAAVEGISYDKHFFPWEQVAAITDQHRLPGLKDQVYIGIYGSLSVPLESSTKRPILYFNASKEEIHNLSTLQLLHDIMNSDAPIVRKGTTD